MSATTQVPIEIDAEAADRVAELGMRSELIRMIEFIRQTVPGVELVEVVPYYDYEEGGPPGLLIVGWRGGHALSPDDFGPTPGWWEWAVKTYPPDVMRWFSSTVRYRGDYGR